MSGITIFWSVPSQVTSSTNFTKVQIYSSPTEQSGQKLIATIEAMSGINYITSYTDLAGTKNLFYIVRYFDPLANAQTGIITAYQEFTPREVRLITQLKTWLPQVLARTTSDNDLRESITIALQTFNMYPPSTGFTIDDLPTAYEGLLLMASQVTTLFFKYLGIGIRDFSYSDAGLSLTIDRGSKMKQALDDLMGYYNSLISLVKLDFGFTGIGIGTVQLPIGLGGNINRGIMNILDMHTTLGR